MLHIIRGLLNQRIQAEKMEEALLERVLSDTKHTTGCFHVNNWFFHDRNMISLFPPKNKSCLDTNNTSVRSFSDHPSMNEWVPEVGRNSDFQDVDDGNFHLLIDC